MSGFVDEAQIHAKAGDGGAGSVSFRREAHVAEGGPDGGDGGRGGDVWLVATTNQSSLLPFRDHPHRRATNGTHGQGKKKHGARGEDLIVSVPVGTTVRSPSGELLADLTSPGLKWMIARGGRGGRGNAKFLSNTRRAPSFAEQGEAGEEMWLNLELRLLADVALVGFPNVGKSTLISSISAAKPKIADYPFTTLEPNLGVVVIGGSGDETEFIVADIPGLVEGAAEGRGLGHRFLRHIERARVLAVLLDLAADDGTTPKQQYDILINELRSYQPDLLDRPRIVAATKADLSEVSDSELPEVADLAISAVTRQGLKELTDLMARAVIEVRESEAQAISDGEAGEVIIHRPAPEGVEIARSDDGSWEVLGRSALRAVAISDLTDDQAIDYVQAKIRRLGVERALVRAGVREGDTVKMGKLTFTYHRNEDVMDSVNGSPGSKGEEYGTLVRRRRTKRERSGGDN